MNPANVSENGSPSRPFPCDYGSCNKSFNRKSDLQRHVRIHTKERPFFCTIEGCGKSFIQRSALTVHVRTHTGEKPHVCEHDGCSKKFSDSSSLARHRRIHTGKRPYKCVHKGCSKVFCRKTTMVKHQRRSHERHNQIHDEFDVSDTDSDADDDMGLNGEPLQYSALSQPSRIVPSQRSMLQSQPMSTSLSQMPMYHPSGPRHISRPVHSQSYTNAETYASPVGFMPGNISLAHRPLFPAGMDALQMPMHMHGDIHPSVSSHQAHQFVGGHMFNIPFDAAMQSSLSHSVHTSPVDLYNPEDVSYPQLSFSSADFNSANNAGQHDSFASFDSHFDGLDAPELTDEPSRPSTPQPLVDAEEVENASPLQVSPVGSITLYDIYQGKLELEAAGLTLPSARWAQQ